MNTGSEIEGTFNTIPAMDRPQTRKMAASYKGKITYSIGMYISSFFCGWVVGLKGPAFIDLLEITGVDTSRGAAFFTAAAVGTGVGNLAGGAIYDRYNRHIVLFVSASLYAVTFALIPWCSEYWTMVLCFLMHELINGAARSGINVEIVEEWGVNSKPYMIALHFSFSLGASVSPFILEPFLHRKEDAFGNDTNVSSIPFSEPADHTPSRISIHYGFLLVGLLSFLSSFVFLLKYWYERKLKRENAFYDKHNKANPTKVLGNRLRLPLKVFLVTLVLLGMFYFFLDEVEDTSPSFLAIFVVKQLGWTKQYGSRLTAAFWAAHTAGRGVGIGLVKVLSNLQLFSLTCGMLCVGHVGLLLSANYYFGPGIWISVIVIGLSLSLVFPASLSWVEKDLLPLSGKLMGVIFLALSLGGLANPQLIGITMELFSPIWYSYILCGESVLFSLSFIALVIYARCELSKYHQREHNLIKSNTLALIEARKNDEV